MKIEVDIEVLLCLLKDEAELTRSRRERSLPMPVEVVDTGSVYPKASEIYKTGWKTGYWQGVECVIDNLRNLVEE